MFNEQVCIPRGNTILKEYDMIWSHEKMSSIWEFYENKLLVLEESQLHKSIAWFYILLIFQ